ncbi:MAG: AarF/UbiB family protein [Oligoflexia bacterium]|nr:AarF/UbiB family protein [Oligoflexia bacterium]
MKPWCVLLRSLALVWALAVLAPSSALGKLEEAAILKMVERDYGQIISPDKAPAVYEMVGKIFEDLSRAHNDLIQDGFISINKIRLIDSVVKNAVVYPVRENAVRKLNNHVFITTALFESLLKDAAGRVPTDSKSLCEGLSRVAGVLAHELAHPLDIADADGFKGQTGGAAYSQAIEVRADSEAILILRKAGYPDDSVLRSLERYFEEKPDQQTSAQAGLRSHPHDELRLSAQRSALTLHRYDQGSAVPRNPGTIKTAFVKELQGLADAGRAAWSFRPAASVSEVLDRLQALKGAKNTDAYIRLEQTRLVQELDRLLLQQGENPLGAGVEGRLREFFKAQLDEKSSPFSFPILSKEEFARELRGVDPVFWPKGPDHFERVEKIPYYRNPSHVQWVRENHNPKRLLSSASRFLPSDALIGEFAPELEKALLSGLDDPSVRPSSYLILGGWKRSQSPEGQSRVAELLHERVLPKLSLWNRSAVAVSLPDGFLGVPWTNSGGFAGLTRDRAKFANNRLNAEALGHLRAAYRRLWEDRGYWGVLELRSERNIDWNVIWETLGIPKDQGASQLRSSVKAYTQSERYLEFLKSLNDDLAREDGSTKVLELASGGPRGKVPPAWLDDSLYPYLSGQRNAALQAAVDAGDSRVGERALATARTFAEMRPASVQGPYRKTYFKALQAAVTAKARDSFAAAHAEAGKQLSINKSVVFPPGSSEEALDFGAWEKLRLPAAEKRQLLAQRFGRSVQEWMGISEEGLNKSIARALVEEKVYGEPSALLRQYLKEVKEAPQGSPFMRASLLKYGAPRERSDELASYYAILRDFSPELQKEVETLAASNETLATKRNRLLSLTQTLLDPADGLYGITEPARAKAIRELKATILAVEPGLSLSKPEKMRLFERLTALGATEQTDRFLKEAFPELFDGRPMTSELFKWSEKLLEGDRLYGNELRLDFARKTLSGEVRALAAKPVAPEEIDGLIQRLNRFVPQGSLAKDEFLDELSWKLNLKGRELQVFIEDQKSYNWKKTNPLLVNMGSSVSVRLSKLSTESRLRLIDYLIHPDQKQMPEEVYRELTRIFRSEALENAPRGAGQAVPLSTLREANRLADVSRTLMEQKLLDSTPVERIPLLEMLLKSGPGSPALQAGYPLTLIRGPLQFKPGSVEEKLLLAFLKVIPEHEKSVTLAYLLSQAGKEGSGLRSLFEVFQTVGIKFGQMSSVWKLFGEESSRDLALLKDNAKPMTKLEVEQVLDRVLAPEERGRIRRLHKVLGSASLKTVVEAELDMGERAVLLVQRPNAGNQIKSNLELSRKFLSEVKQAGVKVPTGLFDLLVDDLELQLGDELRMSREAVRIDEAAEQYRRISPALTSAGKGVEFEVPGLVQGFERRDELLVMRKASGVPWKALDSKVQARAGRPIVEASLAQLFREGWFDPDRHSGNFLVKEAEGKVQVSVIDFGQAFTLSKSGPFSRDERYLFAQFLRALSGKSPAELAEVGAKMSVSQGGDLPGLKRALAGIFGAEQTRSFQDEVIEVIGAFADHGFKLDRKYTVGGLKGLMLLYGENYVRPEEFRQILGNEVKALLVSKVPVTLRDSVRGVFRTERCSELFRSLLRRPLL